jgi:hypothetical protein
VNSRSDAPRGRYGVYGCWKRFHRKSRGMIKITKQDAVTRLFAQAVKLHFAEGDELAAHLLLTSALRICRDIVVKNKPEEDWFTTIIKPEHQKLMLSSPCDVRELNDLLVPMLRQYYLAAFGSPVTNIFIHWATLVSLKKYPELFIGPALPQHMEDYLQSTSLDELIAFVKHCIANPSEALSLVDRQSRGWTW